MAEPYEGLSDRSKRRKLDKWNKLERDLREKALRACVVTPEGRALLWWLLDITNVDSTPFGTDPHLTAFACGQQNVGLQLKAAIIEADPQGYVKMLQEKASEREQRASELNSVGRDNDHGQGSDYDGYDE